MPNLADEQYLSYTDEIQCNCLKNIIDQNINTDDETNTCQLIKHTSYYDVEQFKHLADTHKDEFTVLSSNINDIQNGGDYVDQLLTSSRLLAILFGYFYRA